MSYRKKTGERTIHLIKGLHIKEPGEKQLTRFGWGAAILSLALAGWLYLKADQTLTVGVTIWGALGLVFLVCLLTSRPALRAIFIFWMTIGAALGWINLRILMAITLYLVFTPIRVIQKLIGRDPLERTLDPKRESYLSKRQPLAPDHFKRMF
jgi:hypothetical protein